jgi:hypothetical protein
LKFATKVIKIINLIIIGNPTSWSKLEETNDRWQLLITPSFLDKRRIQQVCNASKRDERNEEKWSLLDF